MAVINLLTDFGVQDEFVGVMHGVILTINPAARIVDLCHAVPPGDVQRAALLLSWSYRFFQKGTIHVAVVDPGVGTARRILCARAHGQLFVAPDNGLLTSVLQCAARPIAHLVKDPRYWLPSVNHTFHGRHIFAPVAAHLSKGVTPSRMGPRVTVWQRLELPGVVWDGREWRGAIIDVDRFGNLITSVDRKSLEKLKGEGRPVFRVGGRTIAGIVRTYGEVKPGDLAAMVGSRGLVEFAVRDGCAARRLGVKVGDPVSIRTRRGDHAAP